MEQTREQRKPALYGHFIRKAMCKSKSVANVIKERGPWAGLLIARLIACSDMDGRFLAEPHIVQAECFPWHPRSIKVLVSDLACIQRLGIIRLYQSDGTKHQPKVRDDRYVPSELPAPPCQTSQASLDMPLDGQSVGHTARRADRHEDGQEADAPSGQYGGSLGGSNYLGETSSPGGSKKTKKAPSPAGYSQCLEAFYEGFKGSANGEHPAIDGSDGNLLIARLKQYRENDGWEKVRAVIRFAVSGKDKGFPDGPPALRTLLSSHHFNRILGYLASRGTNA